jgi:tetratricopeptide (TPR) repeat protein
MLQLQLRLRTHLLLRLPSACCRDALRAGKRLLKEGNGAAAMVRFEKALMLSKALKDKVQERRAMRGLAASSRLQGQYKTAIGHLERVLEISKEMKEYTGDADAYGTIADCYTDLGDLEKAAAFYDRYIDAMNRDGPV